MSNKELKELSEKMATIVTEDINEHYNYRIDVLSCVKSALKNFSRLDISDAEKRRILGGAVGGLDRRHVLHLILFYFDTFYKLKKSGKPDEWQKKAMRCLQEELVGLGIGISTGSEEVKPKEIVVAKLRGAYLGEGVYMESWYIAAISSIRERYLYVNFLDLSYKVCMRYGIFRGSYGMNDVIGEHQIIGRFSFI